MLRFYLEGGKVVQSEEPGAETEFDPSTWGCFMRGSLAVRAVRIPRPFRVGAETCNDGYLVYEGGQRPRLFAMSAQGFSRHYRALAAA